ncbi:unnamed protein product [Brugia pahangi]|uniref:Uncharacterized protein n=1 Tax=Brugia pahangi TaxID=6280 RepID=A0A0N4TZX0_BRUPA|nr:unnamed protein product [Brugia pahangi]VDN95703.1 unnamed protein product [Brugia pahangi]
MTRNREGLKGWKVLNRDAGSVRGNFPAEGQLEDNLSTSSLSSHVRAVHGTECHTNKRNSHSLDISLRHLAAHVRKAVLHTVNSITRDI